MTWFASFGGWLVTTWLIATLLMAAGFLLARFCRRPALRIQVLRWTVLGTLVAPLVALVPGYPRLLPARSPDQRVATIEPEGGRTDRGQPDNAMSVNSPTAESVGASKPLRLPQPPRLPQAVQSPPNASTPGQPDADGKDEPSPAEAAAAVVFNTPKTDNVGSDEREKQLGIEPPPAAQLAAAAVPQGRSMLWWIAVAYLTGLAVMIGWSFFGLMAVRHLIRRAAPASDKYAEFLRFVQGERRRRVDIRVSDRLHSPLTVAWFRPVLLFPKNSTDDDRQLRWSMAHEWAHVENGDTRFWPLVCGLRCIYFFHPLAWMLGRQLYLEQDYLADALAARQDKSVADYADFLMQLAIPSAHWGWGLGMGARRSTLYRRIIMVVNKDNPANDACSRRWRTIVGGLALVMVAAAAMLNRPPAKATADDDGPAAQETQVKTSAGRLVAKKSLRFMGQTFDQWKNVLETDLDPKTRIGAITALQAFGKNGYREEAAKAIGPFIIYEDSYEVMQAALKTLGKLKGGRQLHEGLANCKKARNCQRILNEMAGLGEAVAGSADLVVERGLQSKEVRTRRAACYALGQMVKISDNAVAALRKRLDDKDEEVCLMACRALGRLKKAGGKTFETLRRLAYSGTAQSRSSVFTTIGEIGVPHPKIVGLLKDILRDTDDQLRIRACQVLEQLGRFDKDAVSVALKLLNAAPYVRNSRGGMSMNNVKLSAFSLLARSAPNTEEVVKALADAAIRDGRRSNLLDRLGNKENAGVSIGAFVEVLRHRDVDSREVVTAYQGLAEFGEAAAPALPTILDYVRNPVGRNERFQRSYIDRTQFTAALRVLRALRSKAASAKGDLEKLLKPPTARYLDNELRYAIEKTIAVVGG